MSEAARIEVVIVEDDPRTLKSLVLLLQGFPEIAVVGSCPNGTAGLQIVEALRPQLVLLDLELPDLDGIEITRRIRASHQDIEVLILTSFEDEVRVYQAIQAGASGYLVKRVAPQKIRDAILEVMRGGVVIESRIARRFWNYFQSVTAHLGERPQSPLSEIERDVLQMVGRGLTNREAGEALKIDRRTVRTHLSHVYEKLGTSSRAEAVVEALKRGLIEL